MVYDYKSDITGIRNRSLTSLDDTSALYFKCTYLFPCTLWLNVWYIQIWIYVWLPWTYFCILFKCTDHIFLIYDGHRSYSLLLFSTLVCLLNSYACLLWWLCTNVLHFYFFCTSKTESETWLQVWIIFDPMYKQQNTKQFLTCKQTVNMLINFWKIF